MDISKMTTYTHDVIVISDTETQTNEVVVKNKQKQKRKPEWVREVQLTKMSLDRIVPLCYRQRCRNCQHYHRHTSKNIKYHKSEVVPAEMKYKKRQNLTKDVLCERNKTNDDVRIVLTRDLYSPITIASTNDMYDNISSCSFESDELEDLIKLTRKRMKNSSGNFNHYPVTKSISATTTQDDYQNISSNDEVLDGSIHSMDTVVLYQDDIIQCHPLSPEYLDQVNIKQHNINNLDQMLLDRHSNLGSTELIQQNLISLNQDNYKKISAAHDISEKFCRNHYLNTVHLGN